MYCTKLQIELLKKTAVVLPLSVQIVIRYFKTIPTSSSTQVSKNCALKISKVSKITQNMIHRFLPAKMQNCRQTHV